MKEFKALIRFIKPYKMWVIIATICMVIVTLMSIAGPWALRELIAIVEDKTGDIRQVTILALIVVSIYIVRGISRFGTTYISHYAAWNILKGIRAYLYEHLQRLSLRFFKDRQTGDIMSRVINDTRNFEILLAHAIPTIVVNGLMFVGVFAILFIMNVKLALLTLIPVPLLAWMVLKFSKVSRPRFRKVQDRMGEVNSILQDNFTGIKEIKAFNQEEHESNRFLKSLKSHTKAMLSALKLSNAYSPGLEFISSLGTVIVIFFGGQLAFNGDLSVKDLVAFLLYINLFYQPIMALGQINEGLQQALGSAERVIDLINEVPEVKEIEKPILLDDVNHSLEFKNIEFHYVDQISVLKNISFKVQAGETLALVGATGVGKTTIASLIPRFYDPTSGEILVDGTNINQFSLHSLRKQISIVSQDVFLFNGTVKENISYGRRDATEEEVIEAAKAANAHGFILDLQEGYETKVGERGVKLSGGQKQRISIARAILKNSPILILDEATSSVDTHTERLIQEALNKLMKNKTTVVIAHRLSTIKDADQIIVLKKGQILEQGTHDELLTKNGLYKKLWSVQTDLQTLN